MDKDNSINDDLELDDEQADEVAGGVNVAEAKVVAEPKLKLEEL